MTNVAIPIVDVSAMHGDDPGAIASLAREIGGLCEQVGFLVIVGHEVDRHDTDDIYRQTRAFFEQPLESKMLVAPDTVDVFRGYTPSAASALAITQGDATPPDLCELYTMNRFDDPAAVRRARRGSGPDSFFAPNLWPAGLPDFRPAFERYYSTMERLALDLMGLFALALGLPHRHFDPFFDDHITNLTVNYYPPQPEAPLPGQLRRGRHSDWGSLTILYQDDGPGGLEVLTKQGSWVGVPHVDNSFIVNLGDLMAFWTNDRWVSNLHRVVNPDAADAERDRISIPFFHQPSFDAVINAIAAPDDPDPLAGSGRSTTSGEWILERLRASFA